MKQTFITMLKDESGITLEFERFADKRQSTVERKILELYNVNRSYHFLYREEIEKSSALVIYATPIDIRNEIEVKRYNKAELLQLIS